MRFDLVRCCPKCPFRVDVMRGWLGAQRTQEITDALLTGDKTFICHETARWDEGSEYGEDGEEACYREKGEEQHCAGALLFLANYDSPNKMPRVAQALGLFDPKRLDSGIAVFASQQEMIDHHTQVSRERDDA